MCNNTTSNNINDTILEPRLKKLLDEEKCTQFDIRIKDSSSWLKINFEKNNYWAKYNHMNYKVPLKITEITKYHIIFKGRYPRIYINCDSCINDELPKNDIDYVYISLTIRINEYIRLEYYSVIESVGFKDSITPICSYVKIYKDPQNTNTLTDISYV